MTGITHIKRCGACHFAKLTPQIAQQDITKRICCGAPPSAQHVMLPGGKWSTQMVRPVISVTDEACALWRERDADTIAREAEDMKLFEQMSESMKQ